MEGMKCGSWRCGEGRPGLEHTLVWRSVVSEASPSRGGQVRWELPAGSQAGARRILILYPYLCPCLLPVPPTLPGVPRSLCLQPWGAARGDLRWDWHCLCRDVYNTLYIFVYKRKEKKKRSYCSRGLPLRSGGELAGRGGCSRAGSMRAARDRGWRAPIVSANPTQGLWALTVCPAAKCGWGAASGGVGVGVAGNTPAAGCGVLSRALNARPRLSPHLGTKNLASHSPRPGQD